jgi:hypothetical protein
MSKKYYLFYEGNAPGQAARIECCGYLFYRGEDSEVSKKAFDLLTNAPGFKAGQKTPAVSEPTGSKE